MDFLADSLTTELLGSGVINADDRMSCEVAKERNVHFANGCAYFTQISQQSKLH